METCLYLTLKVFFFLLRPVHASPRPSDAFLRWALKEFAPSWIQFSKWRFRAAPCCFNRDAASSSAAEWYYSERLGIYFWCSLARREALVTAGEQPLLWLLFLVLCAALSQTGVWLANSNLPHFCVGEWNLTPSHMLLVCVGFHIRAQGEFLINCGEGIQQDIEHARVTKQQSATFNVFRPCVRGRVYVCSLCVLGITGSARPRAGKQLTVDKANAG